MCIYHVGKNIPGVTQRDTQTKRKQLDKVVYFSKKMHSSPNEARQHLEEEWNTLVCMLLQGSDCVSPHC